jgi:hypothetical protein
MLNKKRVRKYILAAWRIRRLGCTVKMTRVSAEAMETIEAKLRNMIDGMIDSHPSVGQTFRP